MNFSLAYPFHQQACAQPDRLALYVDGASYSYGELASWVARAALALLPASKVGVLASRSLGAYVGVLGACWCGAAYVPLDPKAPDERLIRIFKTVDLDALVVDEVGLARLTPALKAAAPTVVLDLSGHLESLPVDGLRAPMHQKADDLAYILFTSGTTGVPKGVMITLCSVAQLFAAMRPRYCPVPSDRVSQTSALVFDVSVFEMFGAWSTGASVHVIPPTQLIAPTRFIAEQRLTIWSSVPSIAAFMRRMNMLKPGAFPSLRYSVFAGETLSYPLAEAWQRAAPFSIVENLYGPTEATVYCLGATVGPDFPPTPGRKTIPSGLPLPGLEAAVLDDSLTFLPSGREGQLAISGGQLAKGYYADPELTRRRFPTLGGMTWYLTGDLTLQDQRGVFHHLGRIDHQVNILGQRVELEEVEAHLRAVSGSDDVAAVAWPVQEGIAAGIVAFTSGVANTPEQLREGLLRSLPTYMVPQRIIQLDSLPLGSSGKVDRLALARYLNVSPTSRTKDQ